MQQLEQRLDAADDAAVALDSARRHFAAGEPQLQQPLHGLSGRGDCDHRPLQARELVPADGKVPIKSVTLESTNQYALGTDISHSHGAFEVECDPNASNVCQNDGFDKITFGQALYGQTAKLYPYRAVERSETKAYWDFAKQYALADHMFFTATASSFIAHQQIIRRYDAAELARIAHRSARRYAVGLRRAAGHVTAILKTTGTSTIRRPVSVLHAIRDDGRLTRRRERLVEVLRREHHRQGSDFSGSVWNGFDAIRKVRYGPDWKSHISFPTRSVFSDLQQRHAPVGLVGDPDARRFGSSRERLQRRPALGHLGRQRDRQSKYWNYTAIVVRGTTGAAGTITCRRRRPNYTAWASASRCSSSHPTSSRTSRTRSTSSAAS